MKDTFHAWSTLSEKSVEEIIPLIITNSNLEILGHDSWIMDEIGKPNQKLKLLDFGCGIGRNAFGFSEYENWHILGYDNDVMLEKSKEYCKLKFKKHTNDFPNINFSSDWSFIKQKKFDCVYSILTFQHIFEEDLCKYLQDIKTITNRMIVHGRRYNDDIDKSTGKHKNTWKILEDNGFYPYDAQYKGYTTYGDVNDHMLVCYKWGVVKSNCMI